MWLMSGFVDRSCSDLLEQLTWPIMVSKWVFIDPSLPPAHKYAEFGADVHSIP